MRARTHKYRKRERESKFGKTFTIGKSWGRVFRNSWYLELFLSLTLFQNKKFWNRQHESKASLETGLFRRQCTGILIPTPALSSSMVLKMFLTSLKVCFVTCTKEIIITTLKGSERIKWNNTAKWDPCLTQDRAGIFVERMNGRNGRNLRHSQPVEQMRLSLLLWLHNILIFNRYRAGDPRDAEEVGERKTKRGVIPKTHHLAEDTEQSCGRRQQAKSVFPLLSLLALWEA